MQLIRRFEDAGYAVNVGVLNAADFGSPQRRLRCFLFIFHNNRMRQGAQGDVPKGAAIFAWAVVDGDAVVPVPPAVWLFGSALGLLGWMKRKTA